MFCTDLLLPLKVNFSYFRIQIFLLLKLESKSGEPESALQKICKRIRNPKIFWPDYHPWFELQQEHDNFIPPVMGLFHFRFITRVPFVFFWILSLALWLLKTSLRFKSRSRGFFPLMEGTVIIIRHPLFLIFLNLN